MRARKGLNQASTLAELARDQAPVEVPKGISLSPEEEELWPIFTSARAAADWRPVDLVLLVQAVKLEVEIRHDQQRLDREGPLVTTASGACKANPLIQILDTLRRSQGSIIRLLGLVRQGDPRTLAARAAKAQSYAALRRPWLDEDSLLAKPWSS